MHELTRRRRRAGEAPPQEERPVPSGLLALQRSAGNQAVARLLADRTLARRTTILDNPADAGLPARQRRGVLGSNQPAHQGQALGADFGALNADGCGTHMSAWILPTLDDLGGTEPLAGTWPPFWLPPLKPLTHNYWVRGHLLNHNLGGPGEARNLTPITKKANSQHHSLVERALKAAAEGGDRTLFYDVTAVYDGVGPALTADRNRDPDPTLWPRLATGFQCSFVLHDGDANVVGNVQQWISNTH